MILTLAVRCLSYTGKVYLVKVGIRVIRACVTPSLDKKRGDARQVFVVRVVYCWEIYYVYPFITVLNNVFHDFFILNSYIGE